MKTIKTATAFTEEIQIRQYYLQRIRQSYSLSLDYKLNEIILCLPMVYTTTVTTGKTVTGQFIKILSMMKTAKPGWV
jgi:hypothetical protein